METVALAHVVFSDDHELLSFLRRIPSTLALFTTRTVITRPSAHSGQYEFARWDPFMGRLSFKVTPLQWKLIGKKTNVPRCLQVLRDKNQIKSPKQVQRKVIKIVACGLNSGPDRIRGLLWNSI